MTLKIPALCLCLLALGAPRISGAVEETLLPQKLNTEIMPYFQQGKAGTFTGQNGVPIAYRVFPSAGTKALVFINGRTEFMEKYAELYYDLRNSGYSIYIMDHRGQGASGRMLADTQLDHVEAYRDYVDDFSTFIDQVVKKDHPTEIDVVAHSMGAAVVTIYAMEHPDVFRSMVFSSPMYGANLGSYSEPMAMLVGTLLTWIGRDDDAAPGRSADDWKEPFQGNGDNGSEIRYNTALQMLLEQPSLAVGGPTVHWVMETIRADRWIRKYATSLKPPTLLLQAEDEKVVMNPPETEVCSAAVACHLVVMKDSLHEIFNERDIIRDRAISLTLDFLAHPVPAATTPAKTE